jgi:hypothetical protein
MERALASSRWFPLLSKNPVVPAQPADSSRQQMLAASSRILQQRTGGRMQTAGYHVSLPCKTAVAGIIDQAPPAA